MGIYFLVKQVFGIHHLLGMGRNVVCGRIGHPVPIAGFLAQQFVAEYKTSSTFLPYSYNLLQPPLHQTPKQTSKPMVLQPNFAKRMESENTPPTNSKLLTSRLHDTARRRRARTSGSGMTRKLKYSVDQAKRRNETRSKASVRFTVTTVPTIADVEMAEAKTEARAEAESPKHQPRTYPLSLPKELARPEYKEVPAESIQAIDPSLADIDKEHIRESLELLGSE